VAGAGLGGAAGKALQNIGEKYLLGENKTRKDVYLDPLISGSESAAGEAASQSIGPALQAASQTKAGQAVGGLLSKIGDKIGSGAAKVGEMFTGVPEQEIKTYAKNADEIKAMAANSNNDTHEAANQMREKFEKSIQGTKNQMNNKIQSTLEASDKTVDPTKITDALEKFKGTIDKDLYPEQVSQVQDLLDKVSTKIKNGQMSVQDANNVKRFLQDKASSAYRSPGQTGSLGTESANAAKNAAATTRKIVNDAEPSIAAANSKLAELHDIQDNMNMNLISSGKPEAALLSAGNGGNARNVSALKQLGESTGIDMLSDAQKLSAMRTFGSPKLMPADSTGKAVGRMGLGAGLGYLVGHAPGLVIGSALTSPAALRTAIDAGQMGGGLLKQVLQSPQGQRLLIQSYINKP
jgi:hypothetical protein